MSDPTLRPERLRLLGRGATSQVELGRLRSAHADWPAGTEVAIKSLLPELATDEQALEALEREAVAAGEAHHPSLIRVLFSGSDELGRFLVLEYIPGQDLSEILATVGPLPEPRVRAIGAQLAGALAALHSTGRVHGDLKPENARLDVSGRAVLLDLGFSRLCNAPDPQRAGSLLFLAPESATGSAPAAPSDVFALGLLLYLLATGTHPITDSSGERDGAGLDAEQLLSRLANLHRERIQPPSAVVTELSPFFDQLVENLLSPDPTLRPSADELCQLLERGEAHSWWRERVAREESGQGARDLPRSHVAPLVGRERELELLTRTLVAMNPAAQDRSARGAAVWITAPAGSGKSRLVTEFAARARTSSRPPLYLYGRASERRESRPLGTLVSLLRRWLQLPPRASIGPRGIDRLNRTVAPREAEALAHALGPGGGELAPALAPSIIAWLRAMSENRPVILFVDDLHRAGDTTLSALAEIARELQSLEVLLILGVRADIAPASVAGLKRLKDRLDELSSRENSPEKVELLLGSLEREAIDDLVTARFVPSVPRRRLAQVLWERSLGNPGLLAEMLRGLEARGDSEPAGAGNPRWTLAISPEELPFPQSIEGAIDDRLQQLEPDLRRWLERFSVIGGRFTREFVIGAFPDAAEAELDSAFGQLAAAGWLTPVGASYRFSRPALREAIYDGLAPEERVDLHSRIAHTFEAEGTSASWETVFHRSYHLRQGLRWSTLLDLLEPLIPRISESGSPQRVLTLAQWAIEATENATKNSDRNLFELLETAIDAADRLGRRSIERDLLDRMVELDLDLENDPTLAARVYLVHGRFSFGTGQLGLARGWLAHAADFARRAQSRELLCDALRRLSIVHGFSGDLDSARTIAEEAGEAATDGRRRAFCSLLNAQVAVIENRIDDALADVARARDGLAELDEIRFEGAHAAVDMLRARIFRSAGRHGRALGSASRAVQRARRAGDRRLEVEANARLAGLEIDLDRLADAESRLRDARELAREIEDKGGRALTELWLGILFWERDHPEARQMLENTVQLSEEIGHQRLRAVALAVLARQRSSTGEGRAALEIGRQAADLLERFGAELTDRVVITGTLAMVHQLAGQSGAARSLTRKLRRRIRHESRFIAEDSLRRSQRDYAERLLEAALSPKGPLYPRIRVEE